MIKYLFLGLLLAFAACEKEELATANTFNVIVVSHGSDCGVPRIHIQEQDLPRLEKIIGRFDNINNAFNAHSLQVDSRLIGDTITVRVRKTKDEEKTACKTMIIGYPWVTVMSSVTPPPPTDVN